MSGVFRVTNKEYERAKRYQEQMRSKGQYKRLADCYAELYNQDINNKSVLNDVLAALNKARDRSEGQARRGGRLF